MASVEEIGIYLGVKRDTVYKWISDNSLPAHKIGRLWKFKKDEVDAWIRAGASLDKDLNSAMHINKASHE